MSGFEVEKQGLDTAITDVGQIAPDSTTGDLIYRYPNGLGGDVNLTSGTVQNVYGSELVVSLQTATVTYSGVGGGYDPANTLNTGSTNSGINNYKISFSCLWQHGSINNDMLLRLLEDGSPIWEMEVEPKDAQPDQRICSSGFKIVSGNGSTRAYVLEVGSSSTGASSSVYESDMEFIRIS